MPNPDGLLLPGMVVRVHVDQAVSESAVLLPQQAVTRGSAGDTVLVLGPGFKCPSPRVVKIAGARGNQWIVTDGLKKGEQVVVDGVQKIRPKTPVARAWTPAGASAPPARPQGHRRHRRPRPPRAEGRPMLAEILH